MELLIIIVLSLVLVPLAILASGPLRIALGILFVLFFPGYTLIAALFPRKVSLGGIERVALSFGLSIAVVPLIGLILNYTPWGIRLDPVLLSVLGCIIVMSAVALWRRRNLQPQERFEVNFRFNYSRLTLGWKGQGHWDKILTVLLIVAIVGAVGTLVYVIQAPKVGERFTEFYVLGPEGKAENYPKEITLGEEGKVILGIVDREHETTAYRVEITIDGDKVTEIEAVSLQDEEKWEQEVSFTPVKTGTNQKVEFLLYKGAGTEPYQSLRLWVDVIEKP